MTKLLNACVWMVLALGCRGKLEVDPPEGGSSGTGGTSNGGTSNGGTSNGGSGDGTGGPSIGSGGSGEPGPGARGEACIPGAVFVEAAGSPAEAEVRTLDRCDEGLTCAGGRCVDTPPCSGPVDEECVVYRAAGQGDDQERIRDLVADDSRVYWIDYGTRDAFGNHNDDGSLMALAFEDGTITTITAGLPGPLSVGITSSHAYFSVDGGIPTGSRPRFQVLRATLDGRVTELVLDGEIVQCGDCFVSVGDRAIWSSAHSTALYSMSSNAATPSVIGSEFAGPLRTDGTSVYCVAGPQIASVPLDGGTPAWLDAMPLPYDVSGEFLYGIESTDDETGVFLDQAPKSGGIWKRVRALGAGGGAMTFQVAGKRFFFDQNPLVGGQLVSNGSSVVTASFDSSEPPVRMLERRLTAYYDWWVGTARALYWSDGHAIYARPIPSL